LNVPRVASSLKLTHWNGRVQIVLPVPIAGSTSVRFASLK